jgi:large subunit ribosomal protein L32
MPPLPKKKYPKSAQLKRRRHLKLHLPHLVECPQCRSPRLAHHVCPSCGTYHDRQVVAVQGPSLPE